MRGVYLFMEQESLRALADDEYYAFELEGMSVVTVPGDKPLGTVTEVLSYPTVNALSVQRENAPPLLICLRKEFVEKIDREARRISVFETAIEQIL
jgi:16S rRNA processing protein RimM